MLKEFLNKFKFEFIFKSSTENYKKGTFNNSLMRVLEKYDEIMNVILPTLREERRKTYSPFLPICPKTGNVLEIPLLNMDQKTGKVTFDNNGEKIKGKLFFSKQLKNKVKMVHVNLSYQSKTSMLNQYM